MMKKGKACLCRRAFLVYGKIPPDLFCLERVFCSLTKERRWNSIIIEFYKGEAI